MSCLLPRSWGPNQYGFQRTKDQIPPAFCVGVSESPPADSLRLAHVCQGNLFLLGANERIPLKGSVEESKGGLAEALSRGLGARSKACFPHMPCEPGVWGLPLYPDSSFVRIHTTGSGGPGQRPLARQMAHMKMVKGVADANERQRLGRPGTTQSVKGSWVGRVSPCGLPQPRRRHGPSPGPVSPVDHTRTAKWNFPVTA